MIRRLFSVLMWGTATAAGGLGFAYVASGGVPPADAEILSWFGLSPVWFRRDYMVALLGDFLPDQFRAWGRRR